MLAWLETAEGIAWHSKSFNVVGYQRAHFAEVKDDHECGNVCFIQGLHSASRTDSLIKEEIEKYGLDGIPDSWRNFII